MFIFYIKKYPISLVTLYHTYRTKNNEKSKFPIQYIHMAHYQHASNFLFF